MKRTLMLMAPVVLLAALGAWAAEPPGARIENATKGAPGEAGSDTLFVPPGWCDPVVIGIAQPETDGTAVGWDTTPAAGNWGGRGADGSFAVAWENDQPNVPALLGRYGEVTVPGLADYVPTTIEVGYLAGLADDDFCILLRHQPCPDPAPPVYVSIDCVDENDTNTNEVWTTAVFPLPPYVFASGQPVTIQIRVTGYPWSGFPTFGQLAVDYFKVWGVRKGCA